MTTMTMAIFVAATLLAVLSMCNVALAFGAVDMPHPFGYNRDGMDEYVLRDCLEAGDLSFLGDAETVRAIYEMRSGPYDGTLLQTQVVVTVPDTSESAPITEWGPPIDLGTGMPNHGAVMFSLGDGPVQDGTFIAEMWVPSNFTEPLPLIVNTPPMQSPYSYRTYREVMRKVATYGFIMIVSAEKNSRHWKSEVKIGDRGIQLKQFVEHQNEMPESLLYGKWNGKAGVWGMSMVRGPPMCRARHVNRLRVGVSVCEHITMHSATTGYMIAYMHESCARSRRRPGH